jgi:AraC family transcriptional regulator
MHDRPFRGSSVRLQQLDGLALSENVYGAATALPSHAHESSFLSLTLSGGYTENHGRRRLQYSVGSVAFHPPFEEHSVEVAGVELRCLNVAIGRRWIDHLREATSCGPELVHANGGPLLWLGARLHETLRSWGDDSPLLAEGLVLEVLGAVVPVDDWSTDRQPPRWFERLEEMIRADFTTALTVTGLAARVGLHPVHLSRTWRRFRRCSIGDFVHRLRIDTACRRMATEPVALADLSLEVGFSDQSQFSRAFKQVTGTTPGRYRSAFRRRSIRSTS